MLTVLLVVAGAALFLLGVLTVYAVNFRPLERYRQIPLPALALVYGILGYLALGAFDAAALSALESASGSLAFLGHVNEALASSCAFNFAFLLGFALVKLLYRGVASLLSKLFDNWVQGLASRFYLYDEELSHWYLREECRGARRLIRNLYIGALVAASLLFVVAGLMHAAGTAANLFYPSFAVLVLGEACFCLAGITKAEYLDDVEFDDDGHRRVAQYAKLQEVLTHYFGDRGLYAFSRGNRKCSLDTHGEFCRKLMRSDDHAERVAGAYFKALLDKGLMGKADDGKPYGELNHDLALSSVRLMQGRSVVYASPFYRDFAPYVFLPASLRLMRGEKMLVVYGSEVSEDSLAAYVREGVELVSGISGIWAVGELGGDEEPDVALLPFSSLGDTNTVTANAGFLAQVSFVLVVDPSSLLATYQIGLSILAEHLAAGQPANYCIFDRNSDGLVDSLSHALCTNLTEVVATEYAEATSVCMSWKVDGEPLQHRLLPGIAQYLGVGIEMGLVALKAQAEKVAWASSLSVPLADQRWIAGQYYGELLGFAELAQEQLQIDERFEFHSDMWAMEKKERRFMVVEDEYRNLFEAYRQFATRGADQAFVNVLCPNYLLRHYMADNAGVFQADAKAVPSLAPDFSRGERNIALSLIMVMAQSGGEVAEEEVRRRLGRAGICTDNAQEALAGMLIDHVTAAVGAPGANPEDCLVVREAQEYDPLLRDIVTRRYFSLSEQERYADCFSSLRNVPLITEEPDGKGLILGNRLYGHVYQSFLPGQFVVLHGKYYEVVSISQGAGVVLRRAADHFTRRRYYRQLRTYRLGDWEPGENLGDVRTVSGVRVTRGLGSVTVRTAGYLDLEDFGNVVGSRRVELAGVPERSYGRKSLLRLEFPGASAQVTATIAVLLSELMVTLFPRDHEYLAVASCAGEGVAEGVLPRFEGPCEEGVIYIFEDSLIDIGLVSCADRNIKRMLQLCWDYLDWHLAKMAGTEAAEQVWELGELPPVPQVEARKGFFRRLLDKLRGLFGGKKDGAQGGAEPGVGAGAAGEPAGEPEPAAAPAPEAEPQSAGPAQPENALPEGPASPPAAGQSEEVGGNGR